MLRNRTLGLSLPFVGFMALATAAWAVTEQELEDRATVLYADYLDLETRIDACPDGNCQEASSLVDELDALGVELVQLHADRDTLTGCGCQTLDSLIQGIDDLDEELNVIVGNWENTN